MELKCCGFWFHISEKYFSAREDKVLLMRKVKVEQFPFMNLLYFKRYLIDMADARSTLLNFLSLIYRSFKIGLIRGRGICFKKVWKYNKSSKLEMIIAK